MNERDEFEYDDESDDEGSKEENPSESSNLSAFSKFVEDLDLPDDDLAKLAQSMDTPLRGILNTNRFQAGPPEESIELVFKFLTVEGLVVPEPLIRAITTQTFGDQDQLPLFNSFCSDHIFRTKQPQELVTITDCVSSLVEIVMAMIYRQSIEGGESTDSLSLVLKTLLKIVRIIHEEVADHETVRNPTTSASQYLEESLEKWYQNTSKSLEVDYEELQDQINTYYKEILDLILKVPARAQWPQAELEKIVALIKKGCQIVVNEADDSGLVAKISPNILKEIREKLKIIS